VQLRRTLLGMSQITPRGCHWIDAGQHCNKPLSQLPSRYPYCQEHLRRSLTEAGWRRLLASGGRLPED
jgi:hypothetical protein